MAQITAVHHDVVECDQTHSEGHMNVAEKAVDDLNAIVTNKANDPSNVWQVARLMRARGWTSVTHHNVLTVAQDLGFTVKDNHIYGEKQ